MRFFSTIINIFFLAGATLLLVFIALSGSVNHFPFNRFFFLQADTSNIPGAYAETAWTFWGVCDAGNYSNCNFAPASPLSPVDNFGTTTNVPADFVDNRTTYYYLTRFSFGFLFVTLCFSAVSLILFTLCALSTTITKAATLFVVLALIFSFGLAGLETAAIVLARNAFTGDNLYAHLGAKMMGLIWAVVACLIIVFFNTCWAAISASYKNHYAQQQAIKGGNPGPAPHGGAELEGGEFNYENEASSFTREEPAKEEGSGIRFFKIKRNKEKTDEESV